MQMNLYPRILLYTVAALSLFGSFTGCVQHARPPLANDAELATNATPLEQQTTQYHFRDLPVPVELNLKQADSMLIKTPSYQGGIVTYEGKVTAESLQQFFHETMPQHGWMLQGSLAGKDVFLAFSKNHGAQCLIKIKESAFSSKVEIWLSEPRGAME